MAQIGLMVSDLRNPLNLNNRICICGHPESRHIKGHSIKRCNGDIPKPGEQPELCICNHFRLNHTK